MSDNNQKHPYHLVDPSPWPLVTSFSALIMAIGFIFLMHDGKTLVFTIGSIAVVLSSILWWRDVVSESEGGGYHNNVVQIGLRYGMILFIMSEVMFFAAWFWAFFDVAFYHRLPSGVANDKHLDNRMGCRSPLKTIPLIAFARINFSALRLLLNTPRLCFYLAVPRCLSRSSGLIVLVQQASPDWQHLPCN